MNKQPEQRVFTAELQEYLRVGCRQAERRFAQVRGFNGIDSRGIVRWKHVYAWEDAINRGLGREELKDERLSIHKKA